MNTNSSPPQHVLNPSLFAALASTYGRVQVTHAGERRKTRQVPDHGGLGSRRRTRPREEVVTHGEQYVIDCPFCEDQRGRMQVSYMYGSINVTTLGRVIHCWKCFHENCQQYPRKRESLWENLHAAGYSGPRDLDNVEAATSQLATEPQESKLPANFRRLHCLADSHPAVNYLRLRGFDPLELSLRWQLGYSQHNSSVEPHFNPGRIIVPILDSKGGAKRLCGWQARSITDATPKYSEATPKYLSCRGMPKTKLLFNLPRAARSSGPLVLCEGVFDCFRVGEQAVAILGCTLSSHQIQLLRRYAAGKQLVILLDRDATDKSRAIAVQLRKHAKGCFAKVAVAQLPDGINDPGEATTTQLWECIGAALDDPTILAPAMRRSAIDGRKSRLSDRGRAAVGKYAAIKYWESEPSSDEQIMGVAGEDGKVRVIAKGAGRFLKSLEGTERLYEDAVEAKLIELSHGLPTSQSFHCLAVMRKLLDMAGASSSQQRQPASPQRLPGIDLLGVSMDEIQSSLAGNKMRTDWTELTHALDRSELVEPYLQIEQPSLQPIAAMMANGMAVDQQSLIADLSIEAGNMAVKLLGMRNAQTGRIYPHLNSLGTVTGRITCSNPELQSLSRPLRKYFVAPPGCTLILADYREYEIRILAELSQCVRLQEAISQRRSIHVTVASWLYSTPAAKIATRQRATGKRVVFSVLNNQTAFGLAKQLSCSEGDANRLIDRLNSLMPEVEAWKSQLVAEASRNGYATTLYGRRQALPNLTSPDEKLRTKAERSAVSMAIQGTAADLFKLALARVYETLPSDCKLLLPHYDAILIEAPANRAKRARRLLKQAMEGPFPEFDTPLSVKLKTGSNWLACS